jgi:hypothetical protein
MTTLKSLMIGSAAAFVAVAGAQAASAPDKYSTKYEPVMECPTGFWNTTGTDVCLRVSGFARLIVWGQNEDNIKAMWPTAVVTNQLLNDTDKSNWYSQARLRFDSRRNTDHGLLRAYAELQATDNDGNTGGNLALRLAFVQMGNWVFGKAVSAFTHGNSSPNGADFSPWGHTVRVSQVRYTYTIGNGLSLALALENPHYESAAANTAVPSNNAANAGTGANDVPTFVAALNYASGPLDAQVSVAVTDVDSNATADLAVLAATGTTLDNGSGLAIAGGIGYEVTENFNVGGKIVYTDAASSYNMDWIGTSGASLNEEILALMGWMSYEATSDLTFQLHGGWADIDPNLTSAQAAALRASAATGVGRTVSGEVWGVGGLFSWRPVDGLDIIGEVNYINYDADLANTSLNDSRGTLAGGLQIQANIN